MSLAICGPNLVLGEQFEQVYMTKPSRCNISTAEVSHNSA